MENFSNDEAVALIKAALESKAIALGGPNSAGTPAAAGKNDAEYLKTLLRALTEK